MPPPHLNKHQQVSARDGSNIALVRSPTCTLSAHTRACCRLLSRGYCLALSQRGPIVCLFRRFVRSPRQPSPAHVPAPREPCEPPPSPLLCPTHPRIRGRSPLVASCGPQPCVGFGKLYPIPLPNLHPFHHLHPPPLQPLCRGQEIPITLDIIHMEATPWEPIARLTRPPRPRP